MVDRPTPRPHPSLDEIELGARVATALIAQPGNVLADIRKAQRLAHERAHTHAHAVGDLAARRARRNRTDKPLRATPTG